MFAQSSPDVYVAINEAPETFVPTLPSGAYRVSLSTMGSVVIRREEVTDVLFVYSDTPVSKMILQETHDFFDPVICQTLLEARIPRRRGILVYGPPGTGKTSLVRSCIPFFIEQDAIVLLEPNPDYLEHKFIPAIRKSDPDRPIVIIWDEFHNQVGMSEAELLSLLDGTNSPDMLLTIGVTNFIDDIPESFRSRPSRFSLVMEMPMPNAEMRAAYAHHKYPRISWSGIDQIVAITKGRPIDYVEEACRLLLMGKNHSEIIQRLSVDISFDEEE